MAAQAGAGLQPGTPDHEPVLAQGCEAPRTLSVDWSNVHATGGRCPNCGGEMSRFPFVIYCAFCEFTITAQSRFSPIG